jgi:hypothetical protein
LPAQSVRTINFGSAAGCEARLCRAVSNSPASHRAAKPLQVSQALFGQSQMKQLMDAVSSFRST